MIDGDDDTLDLINGHNFLINVRTRRKCPISIGIDRWMVVVLLFMQLKLLLPPFQKFSAYTDKLFVSYCYYLPVF
jgi:hypothetical protein